ncbi:MAG: hypothetical protein ACP5QU_09520 [Anaerolineae bacterium]
MSGRGVSFRKLFAATLLIILISGCGTMPLQNPVLIPVTRTPTMAAVQNTPEPTHTPIPTLPLTLTPVPSETPLPTLVLPTLQPNAPQIAVWDGLPTYPGESLAGYAFRLEYDPALWALTSDPFGAPALGHRALTGCLITPTAGRGLSSDFTVEHQIVEVGNFTFEVNTIYLNGIRQFVTYFGGDGKIYTGFEVDFQDNADACLAEAQTVLATLHSIPISEATPQP